jgi:sec-independent protein translocase protein TatA
MLGNLNGWHLIIVLVVVLLLFGATRLPALSKGLAQSMRIFKQETKGLRDDQAPKGDAVVEDGTTPAAPTSAPAAAAPAPASEAAPTVTPSAAPASTTPAPAPEPAPAPVAAEAPRVEPSDHKP